MEENWFDKTSRLEHELDLLKKKIDEQTNILNCLKNEWYEIHRELSRLYDREPEFVLYNEE